MYPGGGPDGNQEPGYPVPQDPYATDTQPAYPPPVSYPAPPPPPIYPPTLPYSAAAPPPTGGPASGQHMLLIAVAAVAIFAIAAVVGVAVWVVASQQRTTTTTTASSPSAPTPPPPGPADAVGGLVMGSGPVRVDVYVDYQCPPCSTFEESTGDVLTDYMASQRITLSIHPVAYIDDRSENRYATRAAAAMACAYESGKGAEFHAYLLENQPAEDTAGPTDDNLIAAGQTLGMGDRYATCVANEEKVGWVAEATDAAEDADVNSVPAVYVNERAIRTTKASLVAAIDNAR
jgi:protein-disulfide isomerase